MNQADFEGLLNDTTKRVIGDVTWAVDEDRSPAVEFRVDHNPTCTNTGEKHKHRWRKPVRDKEAYVPDDITAPPTDPVSVWRQFCAEAKINHDGVMHPPPPVQMELL